MGVDEADLGGGNSSILQLHSRPLLTSQDDNALSLDSYRACSCSALVSRACTMVTSWERLAPLLTASPAYSTWNTCPSGLSNVNQFCKVSKISVLEREPEDWLTILVSRWDLSSVAARGVLT